MAPVFLPLLFICVLQSALGADPQCPFSPASCQCRPDDTKQKDFQWVICSSTQLPSLAGPNGARYSTTRLWISSDNIHKLPSRYFSNFSSIDYLGLSRISTTGIVPQKFDNDAFKGSNIKGVSFVGMSNILPPPTPIKTLGQQGLVELNISRHSDLSFNQYMFVLSDFPYLSKLTIERTKVGSDINLDEVFQDIAGSIKHLAFKKVGWTAVPPKLGSTSYLTYLKSLDLSGNSISVLPSGWTPFSWTQTLEFLDLSENPLASDIQGGSLYSMRYVKNLRLSYVGFATVPKKLLSDSSASNRLDLSNNQIKILQLQDFYSATSLSQINFDGNPISNLSLGQFPTQLTWKINEISLKNTKLQVADFRFFIYLSPSMTNVFLDGNQDLSVVGTTLWSSSTTVPPNLHISITGTSLELLGSRSKYLLEDSQGVTIDISNSKKLQCSSLDWLTKYVLDTKQVITDGAVCADHGDMPLDAYLKNPPATTPRNQPTEAPITQQPFTRPPQQPTTKGAANLAASLLTFVTALGVLAV